MRLNTKTAALAVVLYLVGSIGLTLFAAIFLGGANEPAGQTRIDDVVDYSLVANLIVTVILLLACFVLFRDSLRDIFFERTAFRLSRLYWALPLAHSGVALFALLNVDYSAMALSAIGLTIVAALSIGINEEIVTRGILLVGLRNDKLSEWKVYVITLVVFSLLHVINLIAGGSVLFLAVQIVGGTIFYVARRISNTLIVPILMHALYDIAFFLLPGPYLAADPLPDQVLNIQFASFVIMLGLFILFLIFGRNLLKNETTGWEQA